MFTFTFETNRISAFEIRFEGHLKREYIVEEDEEEINRNDKSPSVPPVDAQLGLEHKFNVPQEVAQTFQNKTRFKAPVAKTTTTTSNIP